MKPEIIVDIQGLCLMPSVMPLGFAVSGSDADVSGMCNHGRPRQGSCSVQPLRAMSGSVVLMLLRAVLMSVPVIPLKPTQMLVVCTAT